MLNQHPGKPKKVPDMVTSSGFLAGFGGLGILDSFWRGKDQGPPIYHCRGGGDQRMQIWVCLGILMQIYLSILMQNIWYI